MFLRVDKLANNLLTFGRSHLTERPFFILITMKIEKVFVTPDLAASLLKSNTKNRPLSPSVIARYVDEIKKGRWKEETGELIKVSKDGYILDGQHRLTAIVRAGVGLFFHIATDVENDVFDVLDTGKRRNGADSIAIFGEKYSTSISAAITAECWILSECKGKRGMSNAEIVERYEENKERWSECGFVGVGLSNSISKALSPSWAVAFLFHFSRIDHDESTEFMRQLCEGKGVKNNSIHLLRRRLIDAKVSKQYRLPDEVLIGLVLKTWNAFRRGHEISQLRYKPAEEVFPNAI